jgi:hypothetical protein
LFLIVLWLTVGLLLSLALVHWFTVRIFRLWVQRGGGVRDGVIRVSGISAIPRELPAKSSSDVVLDSIGLNARCIHYSVPKELSTTEENADAIEYNLENQRFAIADGVSGSFFAKEWARLLVRSFTERNVCPANLRDWTRLRCKEWREHIDWEELEKNPEIWWAEEMKRNGAASTLLGFVVEKVPLSRPTSYRWNALAVGDSCLFQVRDGDLVHAFPIDRFERFSNTPWVLCSVEELNLDAAMTQWTEGDCRSGDVFLLATDALAKWFIERKDAGGKPWVELLSLDSEKDFQRFVLDLRARGLVRDDDTTLGIVKLGEATKAGSPMGHRGNTESRTV